MRKMERIPNPPRSPVMELPPVPRDTPTMDGDFDRPPSGFPEVPPIGSELPVSGGTDDGPIDPKFD